MLGNSNKGIDQYKQVKSKHPQGKGPDLGSFILWFNRKFISTAIADLQSRCSPPLHYYSPHHTKTSGTLRSRPPLLTYPLLTSTDETRAGRGPVFRNPNVQELQRTGPIVEEPQLGGGATRI